MSLPDQTTDPRRSSSGERLARVAKDGQKGLFILLTLYLLLSLLSFHVSDPGWTQASSGAEVHNRGGRLGAWLADMILWLSGYPGYLSWLVLGWLGWSLCTSGYRPFSLMPGFSMRLFGLLLFYVGACSLGDAYFDASPLLPAGVRGGGVAGQVLGSNLLEILGLNGYTLLMLGLLMLGLTLYMGIHWLELMDYMGRMVWRGGLWCVARVRQLIAWVRDEGQRYTAGLHSQRLHRHGTEPLAAGVDLPEAGGQAGSELTQAPIPTQTPTDLSGLQAEHTDLPAAVGRMEPPVAGSDSEKTVRPGLLDRPFPGPGASPGTPQESEPESPESSAPEATAPRKTVVNPDIALSGEATPEPSASEAPPSAPPLESPPDTTVPWKTIVNPDIALSGEPTPGASASETPPSAPPLESPPEATVPWKTIVNPDIALSGGPPPGASAPDAPPPAPPLESPPDTTVPWKTILNPDIALPGGPPPGASASETPPSAPPLESSPDTTVPWKTIVNPDIALPGGPPPGASAPDVPPSAPPSPLESSPDTTVPWKTILNPDIALPGGPPPGASAPDVPPSAPPSPLESSPDTTVPWKTIVNPDIALPGGPPPGASAPDAPPPPGSSPESMAPRHPVPDVNPPGASPLTPPLSARSRPGLPPAAEPPADAGFPVFTDAPRPPSPYQPPALNLLDPVTEPLGQASGEHIQLMSREVETRLADFGVKAEVVAVLPGPVVTRYELQPAPGVKGSKITNLSRDLARSLSVTRVRVVEVIPGKSVLGLEIPNPQRETVGLREIFAARAFSESTSPLTLALGKDISGEPRVMELDRMPHLLVAGTTGSGKSVALNAMILSVLYRSTPRHARLILIDPKLLELSVYEGIPHLLAPVVTDMKLAANALRWCVNEMERRYGLMAALGVRNLDGYHRRLQQARQDGQPLRDPHWQPDGETDQTQAPELNALPYIVVVIDELADLMMTTGKKVEELIARLAQKARASGIHLILATQRPSVDVITGLIKANIPARIAFQVSSGVDSRTVLDQMGAEMLLGHGDMLFLPSGSPAPERVHGAFVSDEEVHRVTEYLRQGAEPDYCRELLQEPHEYGAAAVPGIEDGEGPDALYNEAVQLVVESRRASISYVQRCLRIGYNRAARLIEEMERNRVVGPPESSGSREVLRPAPDGSRST